MLLSFISAYCLIYFDFVNRPLLILATIILLLWFLLDSFSAWLKIRMLNYSEVPLFPRFKISNDTAWPNQKQFITIREWLRSNHFTEVQSLKANITPDFFIKSTVYLDPTETIFIQVLFIPQVNGKLISYFTFMSHTYDNDRIITDNVEMPFGWSIPANWSYTRKPLCCSLDQLFRVHQDCIKAFGKEVDLWETQPVDEINMQKNMLEHLNIQEGFLFPHDPFNPRGKITQEGRYLLWKKHLILRYLGIV